MAVDLPGARAAPLAAASDEARLDAVWTAAQRWERWRRLLLPVAGGAALLFVW